MQVSEAALVTLHGPRWRLLIIGAGQLSRFVAQIAQGMDYAVTVCDPREEYRDSWQVEGVELATGMPDDVVQAMKLDARCAVIALTHDPKLDDLALMEALRSPAFYVGAIGSRLNNQRRRERLAEHFDMKEELGAGQAARPDRPLHRQQDAARDRDLHPGRTHGGEEPGGFAERRGHRRSQGAGRLGAYGRGV
jgi:hypothetical protein